MYSPFGSPIYLVRKVSSRSYSNCFGEIITIILERKAGDFPILGKSPTLFITFVCK